MVKSSRRALPLWVDERRRFPRVKSPVMLRSPALRGLMQPVRDIGIGGLRVRMNRRLRVNDEHTVGVVLPSGRELLCRVRVVWSGGRREGQHEAGLQILSADKDIGEVWQVVEELPA